MENIENLKALVNGHKLNNYQRSLALNEFKYLLSEVPKLESRIKELEEEKTTELTVKYDGTFYVERTTNCCGVGMITTENYCPNCGRKIKK